MPGTLWRCNVRARLFLLSLQKSGSGVNLRNSLNLRELTAADSLSLKESRFLLAPSQPLHLFLILAAFFFAVK